jgi:hypothetical protein
MPMSAAVNMSSLPLQGFDCAELLYSDYSQLPQEVEAKLGAKYSSLEDLVKCVLACLTSPQPLLHRGLHSCCSSKLHIGRDKLCRNPERKSAVHTMFLRIRTPVV